MKENFTQVPNKVLDDATLSWDEKGMLTTFFRNKRDWKAYKEEFVGRSTNGKTVINRIFKSLEEKGLIEKKVEGGERLNCGRFTPKETYYLLSQYSISLLEGNTLSPIESTASRWRVSGDLQPLTEFPPTATNKTNYNNTKYNKTKENKTNSESVSVENFSLENKVATQTETDSDFIFLIGNDGIQEKTVAPSSEDKAIDVESNRFVVSNSISEELERTQMNRSNILVEGESVALIQPNNPSIKKVDLVPEVKTKAQSKYFFNYGERPSLDKITAYVTQKGYSNETAYEVFNVLADNDYLDSGGNPILSIEGYINIILSQKKKEIKPEVMKELRALSNTYADTYANELEENTLGFDTYRLNMWEHTKSFLSNCDNDYQRTKEYFKMLMSLPTKKPSSFQLQKLLIEKQREKTLKSSASYES